MSAARVVSRRRAPPWRGNRRESAGPTRPRRIRAGIDRRAAGRRRSASRSVGHFAIEKLRSVRGRRTRLIGRGSGRRKQRVHAGRSACGISSRPLDFLQSHSLLRAPVGTNALRGNCCVGLNVSRPAPELSSRIGQHGQRNFVKIPFAFAQERLARNGRRDRNQQAHAVARFRLRDAPARRELSTTSRSRGTGMSPCSSRPHSRSSVPKTCTPPARREVSPCVARNVPPTIKDGRNG